MMASIATPTDVRKFLFLQGPHGPFYAALAKALRIAGAEVYRVGFNGGDALFGAGDAGFIQYAGRPEDWPRALQAEIDNRAITDVVCYGSSRAIHQSALDICGDRGLTLHVFEEGYLRPYWVTYERGGANAHSPMTELSLDHMRVAQQRPRALLHEAPDRWGDMREHIFWGAVYHAALLARRRAYPRFRPHRAPGPDQEFQLYLKRLLTLPVRHIVRQWTTRRIRRGTFPYHLVLLQLAHDANFRDHSDFPSQRAFLDVVFRGFAAGAPAHHRLVVKAHPLEDGREPLRPLIAELAEEHGLADRVHFVSGGKLARLLDSARSAVTVNSTSAEQALWRGLPVKAFGAAVYNRPEFVSDQPVEAFYAAPQIPDVEAYHAYRAFLLATSQIAGGFYSRRGRRKLIRQLPDLMLDPSSPYDAVRQANAATSQHIRLVK